MHLHLFIIQQNYGYELIIIFSFTMTLTTYSGLRSGYCHLGHFK